jgi:hypothetical protein
MKDTEDKKASTLGVNRERFGKFEIPSHSIHQGGWSEMMALMEDVLVVRCEYLYHNDCLSYTAMSPHFDEGGEGKGVPDYHPILTKHKDDTYTVKWEREE